MMMDVKQVLRRGSGVLAAMLQSTPKGEWSDGLSKAFEGFGWEDTRLFLGIAHSFGGSIRKYRKALGGTMGVVARISHKLDAMSILTASFQFTSTNHFET